MKSRIKTILGPIILLVTIVVFSRYIATHPAVVDKLRELNPLQVVLLLLIYSLGFVALVATQIASLRMCGKKLGRQENFLFSAYSSLVNFFGPGQSGPIFRTAYLKKRHGVNMKNYVFATLVYLGFYAIISAGMLLAGARPWWQTVLALIAVAGFSALMLRVYKKRSKPGKNPNVNPINLGWLFLATVVQLVIQAAIYFVELRSVAPHVSFGQALSYAGAANFSLYAALTPGAIGIREAFLVFSQGIHHISSSVIVAANVIDRAVFLLFLGLLFVGVTLLHAKDKLGVKKLKKYQEQNEG